MDRQHFQFLVAAELEEIKKKFLAKNEAYGQVDDTFHNFRSTAVRVLGDGEWDSQFQVLLTYVDKHMVALANGGIGDKEFAERWEDIIVYALLAMGMRLERDAEITEAGA